MLKGKYFSKEIIFTNLIWKFGERIIAQLISLLVYIILARILGPKEYGAVGLVMVFISIANVFVTNGFGSALTQKKNADNIDFSSVFYANIVLSLILYIIIYLSAPIIADFYDLPVMCPGLRVLGLRIILAAINSVQQAYVSKNMLFKRFFWSTLFGTIISGIVGIVMAYNGFGVWSLIAQYLTNTLTDTVVLWFTVKWRPEIIFSVNRTIKLFSFSWKLLVSSLIDTGYRQLRNLIIGKKYSTEDLAFYNQGDKYPNLITVNINASISSVLFPAMSQSQNEIEHVKNITRKSIQISSYIMWPMMVGFSVIAKHFVRLVLTDVWLPCVPFIRIFCFTYGLWPIHTANLQAINAIGRSDLFLKLEIIKKTIGLIVLLITIPISPLAMAWSLIVADILATFINSFPNIKLLNYKYKDQLKDSYTSLLLSVVMGICIYPIEYIIMDDLLILVCQVLLGIGIYTFMSYIFKYEPFLYIIEIVKNIKNKKGVVE